MHVEMSLESDAEKSVDTGEVKSVDTQTIDGSQVAAAFARLENESGKNKAGSVQSVLVSIAAVMSIVSLYLVYVLVL